jgi:hypothetical protein
MSPPARFAVKPPFEPFSQTALVTMDKNHALGTALLLALFLATASSLSAQAPALELALQIGGTDRENSISVAPMSNGDVVAAGGFAGTVDFDNGPGTSSLTAADSGDVFVARYDSTGALIWAFRVGGARNETVSRVVVDGAGNLYVRGSFSGTVDFDPGAGVANLTTAVGMNELFLAKYGPTGNHLWSFRLPIGWTSRGLVVDGTSGVIICGSFGGTVDFNPAAGTYALTAAAGSSPTNDLFVAKYSPTGAFLWAFRIGGAGTETANALAVDASGSFYVTGYFGNSNGGPVNFNPGKGAKVNLTSNGVGDLFLAKYGADRKILWAFSAGGAGSDQGLGLAIDGSTVAVAGMFNGTADFNPGAGSAVLTANSMQDILVARYTSAGAYLWAFGVSTSCAMCQGGWASSIAIDAGGDVLVAGNFKGTADFDPGAGVASLTSSPTDITNGFAARYTSAGAYASAFALNSTVSSSALLSLAPSGDVFVYGTFRGTIDLDPGAGSAEVTAIDTDIYIGRYGEASVLKPLRAPSARSGPGSVRSIVFE